MPDRLQRSRIILGSAAGVFGIATVVLAFFVFRLHRDLLSNYAIDMRSVTSDLTLADSSLNQHAKVNGTPDYLISMAAGVLFQNTAPYSKGYAYKVANALATTQYIITHPKKRTRAQYASAKEFVHIAAKDFKNSVAMNGTVNINEIQSGIKQAAQNIPTELKKFNK